MTNHEAETESCFFLTFQIHSNLGHAVCVQEVQLHACKWEDEAADLR